MAEASESSSHFVPVHNVCAFLKKPKGSDDYHPIIDFLKRSKLHFALTVDPIISMPLIEEFWTHAKYSVVNSVPQISSTVDNKPFILTESAIRRHLRFDDEQGDISYPFNTYMATFIEMGYEGNVADVTIMKGLVSYNWRFLLHVMLQCLAPKKAGWDQLSSGIASAVHGLVKGLKFNFSHLVFDGMRSNLEEGKSHFFYMYPRFLQHIFNCEIDNLPISDFKFIVNSHTKRVFGNMKRKVKGFSGTFTPLFPSMLLVEPTAQGDNTATPAVVEPTPSSSTRQITQTYKRTRKSQSQTPPSKKIKTKIAKGPPTLQSKASPKASPSQGSQQPEENIIREPLITKEASFEAALLGKDQLPGSIESPIEPTLSILVPQNLGVSPPSQDDVLSPASKYISEVLIDIGRSSPNPSSDMEVNLWSDDKVNMEGAATTLESPLGLEVSGNIIKTPTMATFTDDNPFGFSEVERNPRRQETLGDEGAGARPKTSSGPKDSTVSVDEGSMKQLYELTALCTTMSETLSSVQSEVKLLHMKVSAQEETIKQLQQGSTFQDRSISSPKLSPLRPSAPSSSPKPLVSYSSSTSSEDDTDDEDDATKKGEISISEAWNKKKVDDALKNVAPESTLKDLVYTTLSLGGVSEDKMNRLIEIIDEAVKKIDDESEEDAEDDEDVVSEEEEDAKVDNDQSHSVAINIHTDDMIFRVSPEHNEIIAWGYDEDRSSFWIGREFSFPQELDCGELELKDQFSIFCLRLVNPTRFMPAYQHAIAIKDKIWENVKRFEADLHRHIEIQEKEADEKEDQDIREWIRRTSSEHDDEWLSLILKVQVQRIIEDSISEGVYGLISDCLDLMDVDVAAVENVEKDVVVDPFKWVVIEEEEETSNVSCQPIPEGDVSSFEAFTQRDGKAKLTEEEIAEEYKERMAPTLYSITPDMACCSTTKFIHKINKPDEGLGDLTDEDRAALAVRVDRLYHEQEIALNLLGVHSSLPVINQEEEDRKLALRIQTEEHLLHAKDLKLEKKRKRDAKFKIKDPKAADELRNEWTLFLQQRGFPIEDLNKLSTKELFREFIAIHRSEAQEQENELKRIEEEKKKKEADLSSKVLRKIKTDNEDKAKMKAYLRERNYDGRSLGPMKLSNLRNLYEAERKKEKKWHQQMLLNAERFRKRQEQQQQQQQQPPHPPTDQSSPSHIRPTQSSPPSQPKPQTLPTVGPRSSQMPDSSSRKRQDTSSSPHQPEPKKPKSEDTSEEFHEKVVRWMFDTVSRRFIVRKADHKMAYFMSLREIIEGSDPLTLQEMTEPGSCLRPHTREEHFVLEHLTMFLEGRNIDQILARPVQIHDPIVRWYYDDQNDLYHIIRASGQHRWYKQTAFSTFSPMDFGNLSQLEIENPSQNVEADRFQRLLRVSYGPSEDTFTQQESSSQTSNPEAGSSVPVPDQPISQVMTKSVQDPDQEIVKWYYDFKTCRFVFKRRNKSVFHCNSDREVMGLPSEELDQILKAGMEVSNRSFQEKCLITLIIKATTKEASPKSSEGTESE